MARTNIVNPLDTNVNSGFVPHQVNEEWRQYWTGKRKKKPGKAGNRTAPYSTYSHPKRGDLPIHGPPNWDQIWKEEDDVGLDYLLAGAHEGTPLHSKQKRLLHLSDHRVRVQRFKRRLGDGSYGEVWVADIQMPILVWGPPVEAAIKVMHLNDSSDLNMNVNDMMKDVYILQNLKHLNIVEYLDVIMIPDSKTHFPFSTVLLCLDLCDGDLMEIKWEFPDQIIPLEVCRKWMQDIAQGLEYLYSSNVIHKDIKPGNILYKFPIPGTVTTPENIMLHYQNMIFKLTDFGLSEAFPIAIKDKVVSHLGTEGYKPPEMIGIPRTHSHKPFGKPIDIFSLGMTLCHCLLTGDEFSELEENQEMQAFMRDIYCGAPTYNISPECAMLIFDMISVDWRLRPTIEEVLKDQWVSGFTSHRQRRILRGPGNKNFPLPLSKKMRID